MTLSSDELLRYQRQTILEEIGITGQLMLKNARVLCIGAGGLGAPVLQYLAAAGVGTIGIIDHDKVELSNLQRQVIFTTADIGKSKAQSAQKYLLAINPTIKINTYLEHLYSDNATSLINQYDIIVDCSDNFTTRYLANDACMQLGKPLVSASILKFTGQCSVFLPSGSCLRCLFPEPPLPHQIPSCSEAGVLGVLPGLLGTIQASEVLKWILGIGKNLNGKLLIVDILSMTFKTLEISKDSNCRVCSSSNITQGKTMADIPQLPSISPQELKALQQQKIDFLLLDVREPHEYQESNLGGVNIPLKQLNDALSKFDKHKLTIVHCRRGPRSQQAAALLIAAGFTQVKFLEGGIEAM